MLSEAKIKKLKTLSELIVEGNEKHNLTSYKDGENFIQVETVEFVTFEGDLRKVRIKFNSGYVHHIEHYHELQSLSQAFNANEDYLDFDH